MTALPPPWTFLPATLRPDVAVPVPWKDGLLLALAGVIALGPLARFWSENPDYFFGWGIPLLALYLLVEKWRERPDRVAYAGSHRAWISVLLAWAALFFLSRMILETEPGWRPALWIVTGLYVGALLGWLALYGGTGWVRYFAFPALFLFLGVPWLFNFEFPVVQGLMRGNAAMVADTLLLLDIPARAVGNTIQLGEGRLGVDEACSGIRSLQTALAMSLFLGAFYRLPIRHRLALLGLALVPTFGGNYARLLFLAVTTTHRGLAAAASLHDEAGHAALVFTLVGVWVAALSLVPGGRAAPIPARPMERSFPARAATLWAAGIFFAVLVGEGATQTWYGWREASAPRFPAWGMTWPTGWTIKPLPMSVLTRDLLAYDDSLTGQWRAGDGSQWTALWFRYRPHPGNKIVLDAHNPERCLPGEGWEKTVDYGSFSADVLGITLPVHGYSFGAEDQGRYVFWVAYLNRGETRQAPTRAGLFVDSWRALEQRGLAWANDAWEGRRGLDAETLEVAVSGAENYAAARQGYLDFLAKAVHPAR